MTSRIPKSTVIKDITVSTDITDSTVINTIMCDTVIKGLTNLRGISKSHKISWTSVITYTDITDITVGWGNNYHGRIATTIQSNFFTSAVDFFLVQAFNFKKAKHFKQML